MSTFYNRYPHLSTERGLTECEEAYGVLPCSNTSGGSAFLMLVYGYVLLQGANLLADGSELLLDLNVGPGIVGGLVLPVLGALPDSIIIVVAGLLCSAEDAQEQVAVGMGTLAGSTIMLLTAAWGGSVLLGRCDFDSKGHQISKTLTRKADLFKTGVTCDEGTKMTGYIMLVSCLLYLIVQVPAMLGAGSSPTAALVGCISCFVALLVYCAWQIVSPEIKRRTALAQKLRNMRFSALRSLTVYSNTFGGLLDASGALNHSAVQRLFTRFDRDSSGTIDRQELQALLMGLELASDMTDNNLEEHLDQWMREFGSTATGQITLQQFSTGLSRWVKEKQERMKARRRFSSERDPTQVLLHMPSEINEPLVPIEEDDDEDEEGTQAGLEVRVPTSRAMVALKSVAMMAAGTLVCAIFADPMVGAVSSFSAATGIPAFFVAFVVNPLASNASELVSSLRYAATKRSKSISVTFSQVYGAVTMNNTMCLGLFLLVVYVQKLQWHYTAEVLVMVIPTLLVGAVGVTYPSTPTILGLLVLLIYPLAILANWLLVNVLHLDDKV